MMILKRIFFIAVALLSVASTNVMAGIANVDSFVVSQLNIAPDSCLNLQSVHSYGIVTGTPYYPIPTPFSTIETYIKNGYAGGEWNGLGGINSSVAAADPLQVTGLALISGQVCLEWGMMSSFQGHTIQPEDSLIRYTYYGDANLDGVVNQDDRFFIDWAFWSGGPEAGYAGWSWGDFNYDGMIDSTDYAILDYVDSLNLPPIGTVPEPSTIVMLFSLALGGLLWWRRRA
jgi:hypothetical protein